MQLLNDDFISEKEFPEFLIIIHSLNVLRHFSKCAERKQRRRIYLSLWTPIWKILRSCNSLCNYRYRYIWEPKMFFENTFLKRTYDWRNSRWVAFLHFWRDILFFIVFFSVLLCTFRGGQLIVTVIHRNMEVPSFLFLIRCFTSSFSFFTHIKC